MTDKGYNRFGEILNPKDPEWKLKSRDPLLTKDIDGAVPNAFGKLNNIKGRDYINITDISGTQSKYHIDKFSHKAHFNLETKDITEDGKKIYIKDYNLMDPNYIVYTKSRRNKLVIKDDEKSKPKKYISPHTRRHNNYIEDIEGAKPKKRTWVRKVNMNSDYESENNTSLHFDSIKANSRGNNMPGIQNCVLK